MTTKKTIKPRRLPKKFTVRAMVRTDGKEFVIYGDDEAKDPEAIDLKMTSENLWNGGIADGIAMIEFEIELGPCKLKPIKVTPRMERIRP